MAAGTSHLFISQFHCITFIYVVIHDCLLPCGKFRTTAVGWKCHLSCCGCFSACTLLLGSSRLSYLHGRPTSYLPTNEMPTESTSEDCQTDMSEQGSAKKLCAKAKRKFTQAISNLDLAMTAKAPVTAIKSRYNMLKVIWKGVQGKRDVYMKLLPGDELDDK